MMAEIQSAYVEGVNRRKVDRLVQGLGLAGMDISKVSRIWRESDVAVTAFRDRHLQVAYSFLWLDALYLKVRQNRRIVSVAVVIATRVRETGKREVSDLDVGTGEEGGAVADAATVGIDPLNGAALLEVSELRGAEGEETRRTVQ